MPMLPVEIVWRGQPRHLVVGAMPASGQAYLILVSVPGHESPELVSVPVADTPEGFLALRTEGMYAELFGQLLDAPGGQCVVSDFGYREQTPYGEVATVRLLVDVTDEPTVVTRNVSFV